MNRENCVSKLKKGRHLFFEVPNTKFILNRILKIDIKKIENDVNPENKITNFHHNNSNGWCVRGLLRK